MGLGAQRGTFNTTFCLCTVFGGLNLDALKNTVQDLVDVVGTDATEQICEGKCHTLILGDETALLHTLCTPICRS